MNSKRAIANFLIFQFMGGLVFCSVIVLLATEREAYAYIDPGSGAFIWQTLVVAGLGAVFYFRGILQRAISWIRGTKQKPTGKHE